MSVTRSHTTEVARRYFDVSPDLACVGDAHRIIRVNARWQEVLGWTPDDMADRDYIDFVHPDDVEATRARVEVLMAGNSVVDFENRFAGKDGTWRDLAWSAKVEPETGLFLASARDVTAQREVERERDSMARMLGALGDLHNRYLEGGLTREWWQEALEVLIEASGSEFGFVGRVEHDADDAPYLHSYAVTDIAWNEWSRQHYDAYEAAGMEFHNLETLFGATLSTGDLVISNGPSDDPRSGGLPEGHPPLLSFAGIPLLDAEGMVGMIGLANRSGGFHMQAIDRLQPIRAMLAQIISRDVSSIRAETDPLTGLPNRAAFMHRVEGLFSTGDRRSVGVGLLLLDLDGFKEINDSLGHLEGDRVLSEVASAAAGALRAGDTIARLGGDEFAVLVSEADPQELALTGARLRSAIGLVESAPGVPVNVSIGGTWVPAEHSASSSWEDVFAKADSHLYEAKHAGGDSVVITDG